jgi:hypothetical protein
MTLFAAHINEYLDDPRSNLVDCSIEIEKLGTNEETV